jgi:hypothetical protein
MTQQQTPHQHMAILIHNSVRLYGGMHIGVCTICKGTVYARTGRFWRDWTILIHEELDPQELLTP